jgi:hypothetical protein
MIGIHAIKPSRIAETYLLAAMASKTGFNLSKTLFMSLFLLSARQRGRNRKVSGLGRA